MTVEVINSPPIEVTIDENYQSTNLEITSGTSIDLSLVSGSPIDLEIASPESIELTLVNGQGPAGPQGEQGEVGPQGEQGEQGEVGEGLRILGDFASTDDLPEGASVGDAYLVLGNLYIWDGVNWINAGPVQGPAGPQGEQGEQGEVGPQGEQGLTGPAGTDGIDGTTEISFSIPGVVTTGTGSMRWYFTSNTSVVNVVATVGSSPTGSSLIFDVNKNGTSIFTTQANRPSIAASGFTDLSSIPDVTTFASGDYATIDVDQVGSTFQGSDAVIRLVLG